MHPMRIKDHAIPDYITNRQRKKDPSPFPDWRLIPLVLLLQIHKFSDIHLFHPPFHPPQCQQICTGIKPACQKKRGKFHMKMDRVFLPENMIKNRGQNLFQKDPRNHSDYKGKQTKNRIFLHKDFTDLFFVHPDEEINSKLPAPFFHHKRHNIAYKPGDNEDDKSRCNPDHRLHNSRHRSQFFDLRRKHHRMKGKHQCRDKNHGDQIHPIVTNRLSDITKRQLTQHPDHLPSARAHPESDSKTYVCPASHG